MGALLVLLPWSIIFYAVAKKYAEKRKADRAQEIAAAIDRALIRNGAVTPALAAKNPSIAEYVQHLQESADAAAMLNIIRPAAISADISTLMNAPPEAVHALTVLAQPLDVLTVQRDLNMLGAEPQLPETGELDDETAEALRAFQTRFQQPETGEIDPATAIALRYAVGVVYFQDQMGVS